MTRALAVIALLATLAGVAAAAPSREPKKAIKPAVQARAKRILVSLKDLPGFGWKIGPSQADRSSPHCSYYNPDRSKLTENGDFNSPDFTRPDGMYVSSAVGIFVSAAQARTAFSAVVRPELARCLGEIVAKSGAPGHITVHSAGTLAFPHHGDRSAAYRVVFYVKSGKNLIPATIDLVAINESGVDAAIFFGAAGQPVPAVFERQIVGRVSARIAS